MKPNQTINADYGFVVPTPHFDKVFLGLYDRGRQIIGGRMSAPISGAESTATVKTNDTVEVRSDETVHLNNGTLNLSDTVERLYSSTVDFNEAKKGRSFGFFATIGLALGLSLTHYFTGNSDSHAGLLATSLVPSFSAAAIVYDAEKRFEKLEQSYWTLSGIVRQSLLRIGMRERVIPADYVIQ